MHVNPSIGLPDLVSLQSFTVFSEYFLGVSIIYVLIVSVLVTYSIYGLMLQKAISECIALILFMSCYLLFNDDLIAERFLSFNNSIINDYLSFFTKFCVCFFSMIYFLIIADSLKEQKLTSFEYLITLLFAVLGFMVMCSSNDLLTVYLAMELSSLASYILASFKKTSSHSIEAGVKYFVTGAVSSSFFLLGSSFIYGYTGSINFTDFWDLFTNDFFHTQTVQWGRVPRSYVIELFIPLFVLQLDYGFLTTPDEIPQLSVGYSFIEFGLGLILFSLFIKLAAAPFHLWSLDVYEGSPTPSTFFFAVISKLSIFVVLVRLCYSSFLKSSDSWEFYTLWVGVLSVFVGSLGGITQRKLKTLLAYSSTSHMGYVLLSFSGGLAMSPQMLFFYMIVYIISGLCIWSILLSLKTKTSINKYSKELGDLVLLRKSNGAIAFAFSLAMFSLAGIPPLIGFLAKMSIFLSAISSSLYIMALLSVLFSVISTFYYIRVIKIVYFENIIVGKLYYPIYSSNTFLLSLLTSSLVFLFLNPTLLYLMNFKAIDIFFSF